MRFSFFPTLIGLLIIVLGLFALLKGELGYHEIIVKLHGFERYVVGVITVSAEPSPPSHYFSMEATLRYLQRMLPSVTQRAHDEDKHTALCHLPWPFE